MNWFSLLWMNCSVLKFLLLTVIFRFRWNMVFWCYWGWLRMSLKSILFFQSHLQRSIYNAIFTLSLPDWKFPTNPCSSYDFVIDRGLLSLPTFLDEIVRTLEYFSTSTAFFLSTISLFSRWSWWKESHWFVIRPLRDCTVWMWTFTQYFRVICTWTAGGSMVLAKDAELSILMHVNGLSPVCNT